MGRSFREVLLEWTKTQVTATFSPPIWIAVSLNPSFRAETPA
jgi:hypothetical protein